MHKMFRAPLLAAAFLLCGCRGGEPGKFTAELVASSPDWGYTEGPTAGPDGRLFFTTLGASKGIVSWSRLEGVRPWLAVAPREGPEGLFLDDRSTFWVAATGERKILRVTQERQVTVAAEGFEVEPVSYTGPNDLVVARDGTVYFTDPHNHEGASPPGSIYRIAPDGAVSLYENWLASPNGLALSSDGKSLYVSHNIGQRRGRISQIRIKEDGATGQILPLVTVPDCVADGLELDAEGNFWLACFSSGTAYHLTPTGRLLDTVTTPAKGLTNLEFGRGADRNTLYLTSADEKGTQGFLYKLTVPVGGQRP